MEASQIQHGGPRRLVMSAPTPLRQDFDAPQVRGLARKTKDGPQARRLLALAAIYDGAAHRGGQDRRCRTSDHPGLGVALQRPRSLTVSWMASRQDSRPSSTTLSGR